METQYDVYPRSPHGTKLQNGHPGLKTEERLVGPEEAAYWLAHNYKKNRRLAPLTVKQYARDMAAGNWDTTGDPIRITSDGWMIDGQHRMSAIALTRAQVRLLFCFNVPWEAYRNIDNGRRRSFAQTLEAEGEQYTSALAASLAILWNIERRRFFSIQNSPATKEELHDVLDRHPGMRGACQMAYRVKKIIPASIGVAFYYVFGVANAPLAEAMWDSLQGEKLLRGEPVWLLRDRLYDDICSKHGRMSLTEKSALLVKAWNALYHHRTLRSLRWIQGEKTQEPFPEIAGLPNSFYL